MKRRARKTIRRRDPASRLGKHKREAQNLWHAVRFSDMNKISPAQAREAKARLVEILRETGHTSLARKLDQFRGALIRNSLLSKKIERAIHGVPQHPAGGKTWVAGEIGKEKKTVWIAKLKGGEWLHVDHIIGNPSDGHPYLIGPGIGYDVQRIVVFAYDMSSAVEIAEEELPHLMLDEVDEEDVDEDDQDMFPIEPFKNKRGQVWFKSGWARHSQDIRIFEKVKLERARVVGYREAMLKSGKIVRYG